MTAVQNTEILIDGPVGQLQLIHSVITNKSGSNTVASPVTTVIICHPHPLYGGTMTNKVVHIINKTVNSGGFNTVRFNFRGVGKSQGEFANGVGEVDDLVAVINWLKQQAATSKLFLAGFSFGSYIAAQVSTQQQSPLNIEQLLLVAPPVSMYGFEHITINIPCLIIQGGKDTVVDPEQVRQWITTQNNNVQLEWHDEAEHFFHGKLNFIRDTISKHWF